MSVAALDRIRKLRPSPERLKEIEDSDRRERCRQAADASRRLALPQWPWADLGNDAWRSNVHDLALESVQQWDPRRRGLLLFGPTGAGKSSAVVARLRQLVAAECRRYVDRGGELALPRISWVSEASLAAARRGHRLGQGEAPDVARAMCDAVAVVDEVGFANEAGLVMEVVNARYERSLPTTLTTGRGVGEFGRVYGHAVLRRLVELGDVVDLHKP